MVSSTISLKESEYFIRNKYFKWYVSLIEKASSRVLDEKEYTENHHYIPKSFGGAYTVKLTAREHFISHLLLVKITSGKNKHKMQFALSRLVHGNKKNYVTNSRLYKLVKENNSIASSIRSKDWWESLTKEERSKFRSGSKNAMFGKKHSRESIQKMSTAKIGKFSKEKHPLWGKGHTEFTKQKIRDSKAKNLPVGSKNPMWGKPGAANGKRWYYNSDLSIERYYIEGTQPEGFIRGRLRNGAA